MSFKLPALALPLLASLFLAQIAQADIPTYTSKSYDIVHAKGLVRTPASQDFINHAEKYSFANTDQAVPKSYSLRGHAGPVENQGGCGSCWDFSLTTVLRGTWISEGHDPGRLSFNYLLNCDSTMSGCDGGDFPAADMFVDPKGPPAYGSDGSYTQTQSQCVSKSKVATSARYHFLGTDSGAVKGTTPSFRDIAYVVGVLRRPVSVDLAVDDNWENYSGGVYDGCSDESINDINHMVAIEGYDCESSVDKNGHCVFDSKGNLPHGVGTWIIRNSWGTSWGDKGYITTKATDKNGMQCNAIASDALYFDLDLNK